jgi:predicted DNA-binding protein
LPSTIRFSAKAESRLKRAALRRGLTKSEFIRAAVNRELDREDARSASWQIAKHLCGIVRGSDPNISRRDPGAIVREKHRRIRERHEQRSR